MPLDRSAASPLSTRWAQIGVACAIAFLAISTTGQFQQAYHAHDDWFIHLPIAPERFLWYAETEGGGSLFCGAI